MSNEAAVLDQSLVTAVRDGQLILFLGAGASKGAIHPASLDIPDGNKLRDALAEKFLNPSYKRRTLKTVYDFACSARSTREVQKYIHDTFIAFEPTTAHDKLSEFAWRGLATTNYDLLVERAYAKQKRRRLVPYPKDGAVGLGSITNSDLLYLKLHGCVTEYEEVDVPLITSTEQLIHFDKGRTNLFKQFLEWGQNYPIAFVGYELEDINLRTLVDKLIQEGDGRPRHYIIRPNIDGFEQNYWRDRRFTPILSTFFDFIASLETAIPKSARILGGLVASARRSSITQLIIRSGTFESDRLLRALETSFEHVTPDIRTSDGSPKKFYAGLNQGWYPILNKLDAQRHITKRILASWILQQGTEGTASFNLLKGHAGSGKTITLKRVAWDAATSYEKLVLFLKSGARIDEEALQEIIELTERHIFLFVDDAGDHYDDIKHLMNRAVVKKWPLTVIGADRVNEWNVQDQEPSSLADDELKLGYLSAPEIEGLVGLLETHHALGRLAEVSHDERIRSFNEFAGRQLLVALHEATHGASFEEILESEYQNISPPEAKILYLDICALHRFGPPVRAGLISRVHGISFEEFHSRFFKPLENVVVLNDRGGRSDYTYQARHNYIAEIVFERALSSSQEKFDLIVRILSKLNTDYSYDQIVLTHLIRARTIADVIPQRNLGLAIYDAAEASIGRTAFVLHQRALYESRVAGDRVGLERAEDLLREALAMDDNNPTLKHSLAELALKRSGMARSRMEASVERQQAVAIARQLTKSARTSYAHHTIAKAAIAELKSALSEEAESPSELATEAVNRTIHDAETAVRAGLSRFPNDSFMLTSEAELSGELRNANRALVALRKALASNPKSELIANRLALVLSARGEIEEALNILRNALNQNPGSPTLNFQFAKLTLSHKPTADIDDGEMLLFHFRRAYREGSDHAESQYWYARQLFLSGNVTQSQDFFQKLGRYAPAYLKKDNVGTVRDQGGRIRIFYGRIAYLSDDFGFIDNSSPRARIYFRRNGPLFESSAVMVGDRVGYHLAFNARGPIAFNLFPA